MQETRGRDCSELLAYLGIRVDPFVARLWPKRETALLENWCVRLIRGEEQRTTPKLLVWLAGRDSVAHSLLQSVRRV